MKYDTAYSRWAGVGPYYAMFPHAFVEQVICRYTQSGDRLLDPFAGRSSSIFCGANLGRPSLGIEINPVGWLYGKTKLQPASKELVVKRLHEVVAEGERLLEQAADELPDFFHACFSRNVLRFLLAARCHLDWKHRSTNRTLMTLILVEFQWVRSRSFSNQMRQSRAMEPAYSIRWWRERRSKPPKLEPAQFMLRKLEWRYAHGVPKTNNSNVWLGDSTRMLGKVMSQIAGGHIQPFKLLFTSPPYMGLSDYHRDQWLRLWMLGGPPTYSRLGQKHRRDFGSAEAYQQLLASVFSSAAEVMRPSGHVYVRTDAREKTFAITHDSLREAFPRWRIRTYQRPFLKETQTALFGDKSQKPGERDIILYGPRA